MAARPPGSSTGEVLAAKRTEQLPRRASGRPGSVTARLRAVALGLATALLASLLGAIVDAPKAEAGVYFNDQEYTYKEYWADHASYTGTCADPKPNADFVEPEPCSKSLTMHIPDDVQSATAAVIYIDLWRNWDTRSARFTINNGPQHRPNVG